MKKTLLMAAAALAAGMISVQAQSTVYSQNIVGYVNQVFPVGYTLVSNPLNATNTSAETILPCLQTGDTLLLWNGGGYDILTFLTAGTWLDSNGNPVGAPNIAPGQGYFYENGQTGPETNTYVGTVQLTNSYTLPVGYSLIGSTAPIGGSVEDTNLLGNASSTTLQTGDTLLLWNGGGYDILTFLTTGTWLDSNGNPVGAPSITVGQGFFYENGQTGPETLQQNVIVN